jgi:hypothetical protein
MVVDTPGLYSLEAISPEEQVTRLILVEKRPALVIQVADARNLPRMLGLTLELLEAEVPLLLVLNMMDEAKASGITINSNLLSRRLGDPGHTGSVDFRQRFKADSPGRQLSSGRRAAVAQRQSFKYRLDAPAVAECPEAACQCLARRLWHFAAGIGHRFTEPRSYLEGAGSQTGRHRGRNCSLYLQKLKQCDQALLMLATARRALRRNYSRG